MRREEGGRSETGKGKKGGSGAKEEGGEGEGSAGGDDDESEASRESKHGHCVSKWVPTHLSVGCYRPWGILSRRDPA